MPGRHKHIPNKVKEEVLKFYGGACVVTGGMSTFHHLNGRNKNKEDNEFVRLIPLDHDLHRDLRLGKQRVNATDCPSELRPDELLDKARRLFREGHTTRAFGCARLAHAMRCYYVEKNRDDEVRCAGEALYYLRRCAGDRGEKIFELMRYMLNEEILPVLETRPVLGRRTTVRFMEELASWLNEQGQPGRALSCLQSLAAMVREPSQSPLESAERSRFIRQLAVSQILAGEDTKLVEKTLAEADAQTDHPQNRQGVLNAKTILAVRDGRFTRAWEMIECQLADLGAKKPWDLNVPAEPGGEMIVMGLDIARLERLGGVTYPTLIGLFAHMVIVDLHDGQHAGSRHSELVHRLEKIERGVGHKAALVWHKSSYEEAIKTGGNESFLRSTQWCAFLMTLQASLRRHCAWSHESLE